MVSHYECDDVGEDKIHIVTPIVQLILITIYTAKSVFLLSRIGWHRNSPIAHDHFTFVGLTAVRVEQSALQ